MQDPLALVSSMDLHAHAALTFTDEDLIHHQARYDNELLIGYRSCVLGHSGCSQTVKRELVALFGASVARPSCPSDGTYKHGKLRQIKSYIGS